VNLIRTCVRRRVTVTMMVAAVTLFGALSWFRLDREFMPELQFPQLVVLTSYPNASSAEVENLVTKAVEESVGTVRNVQRVHSSSREGISIVTVEFLWGTHMDLASLNLREKVDLAKAKLPRDAGEPRIEKFNPFALPVVSLSLSGDMPDHELLALARRPVAEMLEKTRGVAAVTLTGGREREIKIDLDQGKLTSRNLPILDVSQAVSRANVTYPAGTVKDKTFDYVVRVLGAFDTVDSLGRVPVAVDRAKLSTSSNAREAKRKKQQGPAARVTPVPILLSDVGDVTDGYADTSSVSRFDGRPTVSLAVLKQAEANVVRVADEVKKKLDDARSKLPRGVHLDLVYDQSVFVKGAISGLLSDAAIGGLLAFLVLILFLGNFRDAVVVSAAIPLSLLGTLSLMEWKGLSLNSVSLAGLAIGIGNLTDGAIVVQENIARQRALGKNAFEAASLGAEEVFGAVTASNLTAIAVFLPLVFVTGIVGQVFAPLSWAIIFSQFVSQIVAFTFIPMMSAVVGGMESKPIPFVQKTASRAAPWVDKYNRALAFSLERPFRVMGYAAGALLISLVILACLPKALFPKVEGDQILVRLDMPVGTSLEATDASVRRLEKILDGVPEIGHRSVTVGSLPQEGLQPLGNHQAQIVLDLKKKRRRKTAKVVQGIKDHLSGLPAGARLFFFEQGGSFSFLGGAGAPVMVEVKGHDLAALEAAARGLAVKLGGVEGLANVRTSLSEAAPEIQIQVKRDALADVSLSVSDVAETALMALKGKTVSKFREAGKEIDIKMRLRPADRSDLGAVHALMVHSPLDVNVPLGAVASINRGRGPSEILRYDQQRTVVVSADLEGRSLTVVAPEIEALLRAFGEEAGVSLTLTGESARMAESFASLKIVLVLSVLFVFMIMASQFESIWEPFLILFSIPLSIIGMGPALLIFFHDVTAMAGMGVVLLAGIVVNNGIVLIDFVNQARDEGIPLKKALMEGCHTRLRPILMTAISTILGMTPLALGRDMQSSMAVVVVSGLIVSTIITLLLLPALFVVVDERLLNPEGRKKWASWLKARFSPSPLAGEGRGGG
jgi:hydrophobic/amphiphilic exporter-1 (mainly G- bacteria), HAE1 family